MPNAGNTSVPPVVLENDESPISQLDWKRQVIQEKIALHELELLAAENEVQRLRNKSCDLNEQLNMISPIMSLLSLDVLTSIFALACEGPRSIWEPPVQFLIGGICREWRRIAWSTPYLWREIFISISEARFMAQDRLFQEWIGRTAAAPLHIRLSHLFDWDPPIAFFNRLLKTGHRWIIFEYIPPSLNFQLALAQEKSCRFTMLNTFKANGVGSPPGDLNQWQLNIPPQLRSLQISSRRKFYLGINWTILDDVDADVTLQDCINMLSLSCSPKTLRLSIDYILPAEAEIPSTAHYCLQNLISFYVGGRAEFVPSLLRRITAPAVKELEVDFMDDSSDHPWIDAFADFSHRSAFPLTKLTLTQLGSAEETALFHALRDMTSLQSLDLSCEDVYELFTLSDHSIEKLNPARKVGDISFTLDALLRMMQCRLEHLQRVHISYLNDLWDLNQIPSTLRDFYSNVALLNGIKLTLEWDSSEFD
ncbi:hypothetical protein GALMADRAFT_426012 [Galerina marginata CBS 339.88]|uniref:F-box domain-containing protein n=1 Tax=Galerina marginata (strain CBS 339.88) TaxID=685588 RepID=A0A067TAX8_GALM3|nr:hypothetical protein GALMADRAFT_426012 [Galerina marginata CBS 339.88]